MIKCLIFDLDDTLYYEKMYVLNAFKDVCLYLSSKYNKDYKELYKRCSEVLDEFGRGKIFDILCDEYGFQEDIEYLVEIYRKCEPKIELYEESIEIFEFAKSNDFKLALITDGCSQVQWNKIKALELEKIMDKIIVTDDYGQGYSKPHERSYKDILNCFKVKAEQCIYIGDNPKKDFVGAKKLGVRTVRIIHEYGDHIEIKATKEYEAEYIIKKLTDIKNIFDY